MWVGVKILALAKLFCDDDAVVDVGVCCGKGGGGGRGSDRGMNKRTSGKRSLKMRGIAISTPTISVCAVSDAAIAPVFLPAA